MTDAADSPAWAAYRRLLRYAHRYRSLLWIAVLGMIIDAACGTAFINLMEPLVDEAFVEQNRQAGWQLPLVIVGLFLLRGVATFATDYGMARAGRSVVRDLRQSLLEKYLRLPTAYFDREPVPAMVSRLNFDTEQVAHASSDALKVIVTDSLYIVFLLGTMFWHSPKVTLTMLVLGPVIGAIVSVVGKRYRRLNHEIQDAVGAMAHRAEQTLGAQQEVKVYAAQASEAGRYAGMADRLLRLYTKVETTRASSSSIVQVLAALALAVIVYVASAEASHGALSAGQFVALMMAMMALLPSLKRITTVQSQVSRGIAAAQRIFAVLDEVEEADAGPVPMQRAEGLIEFRAVSATYPESERPALHEVSFTARPGTVTAIVGRSGSGKTTLMRLLPRFYEPSSGSILLDGVPIADVRLADLRRQMALVSQQVVLFDDAVVSNVALGQSSPDRQAVQQALEHAQAADFVAELSGGLDAPIGDKGGKLSGGQRQRLAIARAMLKDAPILLLDEATAALDPQSERLVQQALDRATSERTTLVIAHRLSTIEHADQVLVLDQGRLVEQGTHAELLARDGLYASLHRMQFREHGDGGAE
ncbi:MAG: lipid A export permease/ATP-binding protein MsbA [Xanthomonadales bacterium]|nr:lipid A export permease/ATP-binding protein MsbA [Xanthomonadales bacterium]